MKCCGYGTVISVLNMSGKINVEINTEREQKEGERERGIKVKKMADINSVSSQRTRNYFSVGFFTLTGSQKPCRELDIAAGRGRIPEADGERDEWMVTDRRRYGGWGVGGVTEHEGLNNMNMTVTKTFII